MKIEVQIYVVAVGNHISGIAEMVKMASSPQLLFRVMDYKGMLNVVNLMVGKTYPLQPCK